MVKVRSVAFVVARFPDVVQTVKIMEPFDLDLVQRCVKKPFETMPNHGHFRLDLLHA